MNNFLKGVMRDRDRNSFWRATSKTILLALSDAHNSFDERVKHMLTPPESPILKKILKEVLVETLFESCIGTCSQHSDAV